MYQFGGVWVSYRGCTTINSLKNMIIVPTGLEPVTSALPDGGHINLTSYIRTARYHCATGLRNPRGFLELIFGKLLLISEILINIDNNYA